MQRSRKGSLSDSLTLHLLGRSLAPALLELRCILLNRAFLNSFLSCAILVSSPATLVGLRLVARSVVSSFAVVFVVVAVGSVRLFVRWAQPVWFDYGVVWLCWHQRGSRQPPSQAGFDQRTKRGTGCVPTERDRKK